MKKTIIQNIVMLCTLLVVLSVQHSVFGQQKSHKKKQTIETKALSSPSDEVTSLKRPDNEKNPQPQAKTRGDVYGSSYSDIIVNNYTG